MIQKYSSNIVVHFIIENMQTESKTVKNTISDIITQCVNNIPTLETETLLCHIHVHVYIINGISSHIRLKPILLIIFT